MKCPLCFTVLSVLACWELFSTSLSFSTWLNSGSPGIAWGQKYLWEAKIGNHWLHDTLVKVCITLVKIHKIDIKCCHYPQGLPYHVLWYRRYVLRLTLFKRDFWSPVSRADQPRSQGGGTWAAPPCKQGLLVRKSGAVSKVKHPLIVWVGHGV